jgi:hypothetical protein
MGAWGWKERGGDGVGQEEEGRETGGRRTELPRPSIWTSSSVLMRRPEQQPHHLAAIRGHQASAAAAPPARTARTRRTRVRKPRATRLGRGQGGRKRPDSESESERAVAIESISSMNMMAGLPPRRPRVSATAVRAVCATQASHTGGRVRARPLRRTRRLAMAAGTARTHRPQPACRIAKSRGQRGKEVEREAGGAYVAARASSKSVLTSFSPAPWCSCQSPRVARLCRP